ncbi:NAD(P)/FAD-dependent oxidoreductase [Dehalogenimonas sp. 4OHTPN]|uniref:NAD(P)/FAD-dependent oxidoreductase n=1 Tax=Dehalogenimonas sp. 4OHTPN TaxID=3166643 RepID=A0AAU8GEB3_9CHLR
MNILPEFTGTKRVLVIGGGAAGLLAAGRAAELGAQVILLERMEAPGKKLLITGKGRCNITNTAPLKEFLAAFGPNGRFLYGAFHRFFRDQLLDFFRRRGVETESERGGRVFPVSDNAADVVNALVSHAREHAAEIRLNSRVRTIERDSRGIRGVKLERGEFIPAEAVILAAGGASYPATGSAGDGFSLAEKAGHRINPLYPALVPLVIKEIGFAVACQGVALKNIRLTAFACDKASIPDITIEHDYGRGTGWEKPPPKVIESRFGEMLFTHFGIGGPITLLMSQAVARALDAGPVSVHIDLKPALSKKELDARLQREFAANPRRQLPAILRELLPEKMVEVVAGISGIPLGRTAANFTAGDRRGLVKLLKGLAFEVRSTLPLGAAMVTAGGVELAEVDPKTMASKLVPGLYLVGEVLDLDADTGGFNLQAAFSTGWVAGEAAAKTASVDYP